MLKIFKEISAKLPLSTNFRALRKTYRWKKKRMEMVRKKKTKIKKTMQRSPEDKGAKREQLIHGEDIWGRFLKAIKSTVRQIVSITIVICIVTSHFTKQLRLICSSDQSWLFVKSSPRCLGKYGW